MMILGIAITAGLTGALLDPYSHALLLRIVAVVGLAAVGVTILAVAGVERRVAAQTETRSAPFLEGLHEVWAEPAARRFTIFVFLSMTAYFMQELILEPYAGLVFAFTPGQSTTLSGAQNGGVFLGMVTGRHRGHRRCASAPATWVVPAASARPRRWAVAALGPVGPARRSCRP